MIGSVKVPLIPSKNISETKAVVQDVPQAKKFQSKGRHSTVSPEELSERWQIGLEQARETIAKTRQRLTRSSVIPLASQYKVDIVFQTKSLTGMWATDTMYVRVKYLDGNRYAQVFSNGTYFAEMYLMYKKADTVQALKTFVMKLGVRKELMVNGSKEQNSPGTEFMKRHFCLLYYFLNLIFYPYPIYYLAQDKNHDPHGDG